MKNFHKLLLMGTSAILSAGLFSCSDDDKEPDKTKVVTIGFEQVSADLIGGPTAQGTNLYLGSNYEIEKGYIAQIDKDTYAQFPINYGFGYSADFSESGYGYSLTNGGIAISNWHDMTTASYTNQLSVYNSSSPSGGNFAVAFGNSSQTDPDKAVYSDYEGCGKIYITDAQGYGVSMIGQDTQVFGTEKEACFKSVYINNTTYTYLVMKNGDNFGGKPLEEQNGWFKVQFIAFEDNKPNERPKGCVEAYLANFDSENKIGYTGIIDTWTKVDLSSLPECSILVINFIGSDTGEWGLNTPAYCALDKFEIEVEID